MKEHGLYTISQSYLELIESLGGECDMAKGSKRPVYCCIKDSDVDGLFWAIPTSDIAHRNSRQMEKIHRFMELPKNDLRSSYYHIAKTTKPAIFKISSAYPITDSYVDHEYTTNGKHVILRKAEAINEIERKLRRILAFEARRPDYFPQKMTSIKAELLRELDQQ